MQLCKYLIVKATINRIVKKEINRIYDWVEADTTKSQARFQII